MSATKFRERRKARLIREHPTCIFCGGLRPTVTLDHVPPRASFPRGYHPEDFDFPACEECNQSTRHFDQIFSLYAMLSDHDEANHSQEDLRRLTSGIANNYPKSLPNIDLPTRTKRIGLKKMGLRKPDGELYKDLPLAGVPIVFGEAAKIVARKLACAVFFTEFGRALPQGQQIVSSWHHSFDPRSHSFIAYFNDRMQAYRNPTRGTIKNYGNRFAYKFAYNEDENFFGVAAQLGKGLFLWSLAARSELEIKPTDLNDVWTVGQPWVSSRAAVLLENCR